MFGTLFSTDALLRLNWTARGVDGHGLHAHGARYAPLSVITVAVEGKKVMNAMRNGTALF